LEVLNNQQRARPAFVSFQYCFFSHCPSHVNPSCNPFSMDFDFHVLDCNPGNGQVTLPRSDIAPHVRTPEEQKRLADIQAVLERAGHPDAATNLNKCFENRSRSSTKYTLANKAHLSRHLVRCLQ
jgi:hypothetical protein